MGVTILRDVARNYGLPVVTFTGIGSRRRKRFDLAERALCGQRRVADWRKVELVMPPECRCLGRIVCQILCSLANSASAHLHIVRSGGTLGSQPRAQIVIGAL